MVNLQHQARGRLFVPLTWDDVGGDSESMGPLCPGEDTDGRWRSSLSGVLLMVLER